MSDLTNTVERYIDIWNESDADRRAEKIRDVWAENATYTDPLASVSGHEAINALIGAAREQFAGMTFTLAGQVDAHHDIARFTWNLAPAGAAEPVAVGFDVVRTNDDGQLSAVYGFLDRVPASS
ncbi:nuclear transport factor 2 family protein [Salinispora cortesiana]|uniref:nuclear transport factor 2 family protein n=1 Tax=Salinispora cortesiana TaxID=1305843 RepID=UPI000428DCE7|nr:nuclear transport factor 2 family protein [Salinispora cortesiana]